VAVDRRAGVEPGGRGPALGGGRCHQKDLQAAWGTYAAAECGTVILNALERATVG